MNAPQEQDNRRNERGNIILYLFMAVILLAALSFAITNTSRTGGGDISSQRAELYATQIIEYSNIISAGVSQLRLRGVDENDLCFDHTSWPGGVNYNHAGCGDDFNKLLDTGGAEISYAIPPSEAMATSPAPDNIWHFYGNNEISDIGTTCGTAACADLILVVDELSETICTSINDALGITNPAGIPPTDITALGETLYIGAFAANNVIGDDGTGAANIKGKSSACFQKTNGTAEYVFYKVLLAR